MSKRGPLKVSGLIEAGKVSESPDLNAGASFGIGLAAGAPSAAVEITAATAVRNIALVEIVDSPYQPRMNYDAAEIDNLAHTMAAAGQQEPISVRPKDGSYELIAGHRRVRAAKSMGWTHIKAIVEAMDDATAERATMVSNEARLDLTDYERAKLYQRAVSRGLCKTQAEIANYFGTSQGRVSKCLAMLELPSPYIAMLENRSDAFQVGCAAEIRDLLKEYPEDTALIQQGVERIVAGEAEQKGLKGWVQQILKQRQTITTAQNRIMLTDNNGREVFRLNIAPREVRVRLNSNKLTEKQMQDAIVAALKTIAGNEAAGE